MAFGFGPRRGTYVDVAEAGLGLNSLSPEEHECFEALDLLYRALCAILYNYVPTSGHPGGSISSGRIVAPLLFDAMDYDFSHPDRQDADVVSYAAGHKAMGLYALWRCATSSRASALLSCCRTYATACDSKTCSASGATPSRTRP